MLKKSFLIFLLSLSIGACTTTQSTLQKKMAIGGVPQFNEYVSPMTVPIQPMYKPVAMDFKYEMAINIKVTENSSTKNVDQYFDMTGKYEIKKLGDMLTWDFVVNRITTGGKKLSPNRALIEARMLTDKFGKIQEIEATSPALATNFDQAENNEFINSMKKSLGQLSPFLPKNPVRSGDPLIKITNNALIEMFSDDQDGIKMEGDIEHIIKGWGVFNEKKVIVTSIDKVMNLKIDNVDIQIKLNGYNLFDPETFQVVDGNLLIVLTSAPGDNKLSGKIFVHTLATKL